MFIILQLDDSYNAAHGSGSRSQVEGESTSPGRKRKRVGTSQGRGQSGRGKSSSTASQPSAATVKTSYHVLSFHIEIHYATLMCFYSVFFFFFQNLQAVHAVPTISEAASQPSTAHAAPSGRPASQPSVATVRTSCVFNDLCSIRFK
jgi:hypothetical protein